MREETWQPRNMTVADLDFLADLQHEMNTQPTLGQRDPRFWVIMDYGFRAAAPDESPTHILEVTDGGDYARYTQSELIKLAYEDKLENDGGDAAAEWLDDLDLERIDDPSDGSYTLDKGWGFCDMGRIEEVCEGYFSPRCSEWVYQVKESCISDNSMFLTLSAAEAHLKENHYHYDEQAHTYAMTAWRSPQVERLYDVLHEVDFRALRCLLEQAEEIERAYLALDFLLDKAEDGKVSVDEKVLDAAATALFFAWNAVRGQGEGSAA